MIQAPLPKKVLPFIPGLQDPVISMNALKKLKSELWVKKKISFVNRVKNELKETISIMKKCITEKNPTECKQNAEFLKYYLRTLPKVPNELNGEVGDHTPSLGHYDWSDKEIKPLKLE